MSRYHTIWLITDPAGVSSSSSSVIKISCDRDQQVREEPRNISSVIDTRLSGQLQRPNKSTLILIIADCSKEPSLDLPNHTHTQPYTKPLRQRATISSPSPKQPDPSAPAGATITPEDSSPEPGLKLDPCAAPTMTEPIAVPNASTNITGASAATGTSQHAA